MRLIIALLLVLLFTLSFWICKTIYPEAFLEVNYSQEAVNRFTDLRYSIYAIMIGLCFITLKNKSETNHEIFIWTIGVELSIGDILDRYYYNIAQFTKEDISIIIISIIFAYLEAYTRFNSNNFNKYINNKYEKYKLKF